MLANLAVEPLTPACVTTLLSFRNQALAEAR